MCARPKLGSRTLCVCSPGGRGAWWLGTRPLVGVPDLREWRGVGWGGCRAASRRCCSPTPSSTWGWLAARCGCDARLRGTCCMCARPNLWRVSHVLWGERGGERARRVHAVLPRFIPARGRVGCVGGDCPPCCSTLLGPELSSSGPQGWGARTGARLSLSQGVIT